MSLFYSAGLGGAAPSTIVDGYEDQDISEYKQDTGGWSTVSVSGPQSGDFAVENNSRGDLIAATSSTGLPTNLSAGNSFQYWVFFGSTTDTSLGFIFGYGVSDASTVSRGDDYLIDIRAGGDEMNFGGKLADQDSSSTTIPTQTWLRVEVDWGASGSHTAKLFKQDGTQIKSVSDTDSSISSGGIYLISKEDTGATYRVDQLGIL